MTKDKLTASSRGGKEGWTGQVLWEQRFDEKRLTVVAAPFFKTSAGATRWAGIALVAPAQADNLSEILANHSHADIVDYATLTECIVSCEAYIERWLLDKMRQVACECAEIEIPAPASAP